MDNKTLCYNYEYGLSYIQLYQKESTKNTMFSRVFLTNFVISQFRKLKDKIAFDKDP